MALKIVQSAPQERPRYAELHARSAFSMLEGACSPEELVQRGVELELEALAILDRDDLGGAVRFHRAAHARGLQPIHGATITLEDGSTLPLLVLRREGWANLCRLIGEARTLKTRGEPRTSWDTLNERADGLFALTGGLEGPVARHLANEDEPRAMEMLGRLIEIFGRDQVAVEVWNHHLPQELELVTELQLLSRRSGVPWIPTQDARYARAEQRHILDVMTCLRHGCTLEEAGTRLLPNDRWHLRGPEAMARLWPDDPGALERTLEIARRCRFQLDHLQPALPRYGDSAGDEDDVRTLRRWVERGARERYGALPGPRERAQLGHELRVIEQLGMAGYFLIVADIIRFTAERGILAQGRGSAANSAVCYCLGITAVDPIKMNLLFERFLSEGRSDPPDIDIDIAHQDREQVLQYVYSRYGRDHAAMVCETITWRGKSAVRDVARVLGLEPELAARLALQVGRAEAREAATALEEGGAEACGLDPRSATTRALIHGVRGLDRLPRHRSIHVGGFVLTAAPLNQIAPIEAASMVDRTILQWDKDDLAPVGLVKIDLLGLGILTVIDRALGAIAQTRGRHLSLRSLPMDDPGVYAQISAADTVGLFQIESRAQMNALPRLQPSCFYDLVVQVAIIRPGPIQGEMVHPYIRRRRGEEPVSYLHPDLEPVLERTLGVPLFQEQGMKVAIAMAGFTPSQADRLRKVMGFKRAHDHLEGLVKELWEGMRRRDVPEPVALRILQQLEGFASYGFPESHAASFALLVYASAWLRHHFPAEYLTATLNAQPMGFYGPSTLVEDGRRHGVEVRPVDLLFSAWDTTLEEDVSPPAVRLGLRLIRGISGKTREKLERALRPGRIGSLHELMLRADDVGLGDDSLLVLARAGALRTLWPGRRAALWELLRRLRERQGSLALHRPEDGIPASLHAMTELEETAADYRLLGLSPSQHPMAFHRAQLRRQGVRSAAELREAPNGAEVWVGGLVICRQRPGSANGVFFLTLEDEEGMVNIVVMPRMFEEQRLLLASAPALMVHGRLEHAQGVRNVLGDRFCTLDFAGETLTLRSRDFH